MSDVKLHLGDCLEILPTLEAGSVDMVITSPPYNVGVKYGDKSWEDDRLDVEEYKIIADNFMTFIQRLMVIGGRVCVEIGGSGRNLPLSWMWQDAAYQAGLGLYSEIGIQHRKTNPTAWGSWMKSDMVYTIPNFHMAYVFYKEIERKNGHDCDIERREFIDWTRGYWKINYSKDNTKEHPAQFPLSLPKRFMKLFGHTGDTILDPFMGSGTTGVACVQLRRNFIGIEIEPKYYDIAEKRIKQAQRQTVMDL